MKYGKLLIGTLAFALLISFSTVGMAQEKAATAPATAPVTPAPEKKAAPAATPATPAAEKKAAAPAAVKDVTVKGTIEKVGDAYILKVSDKETYSLSGKDVKDMVGKKVEAKGAVKEEAGKKTLDVKEVKVSK